MCDVRRERERERSGGATCNIMCVRVCGVNVRVHYHVTCSHMYMCVVGYLQYVIVYGKINMQ